MLQILHDIRVQQAKDSLWDFIENTFEVRRRAGPAEDQDEEDHRWELHYISFTIDWKCTWGTALTS